MRKTSQDDTTSITSGIENETKKPGGIMKTKRSSIKRKVQTLSHESDDAVIEPLLQREKEKTDSTDQSAKYDLLSKTKTEVISERKTDKEKFLYDNKTQKSTMSDVRNVTDTLMTMPSSNLLPKSTGTTAPLHNHMNTNVFNSHDALKGIGSPKTQILVEIDGNKQSGYNPSPLIFTTAKIHTDGKTKNMEPLQITPVPILSTVEVSVLKGKDINNIGETSGVITSNITPMYANQHTTNILDKEHNTKSKLAETLTAVPSKIDDSKSFTSSDKQSASNVVPTKHKKVSDNAAAITSDLNKTEMKIAESSFINNATQKGKEAKQTKMSLSQPTTGASAEKIKTTAVTDTNKPSISSVNAKTIGTVEQAVKVDKTVVTKSSEPATDLNKNIKPIEAAISKDKAPASNTKQLQRQKTAVVKDDPPSTHKSNIDASTTNNDSKIFKKSDDCVTAVPKPITQIKSPPDDVKNLNDSTKMPKSTVNNTQIASRATTTSVKPPSVTTTVTINKSTPSYSTSTSVKPTMTPQTTKADAANSSSAQPSSVTKSLPSNVVTTGSSIKATGTISTAKPQTTSVSSSKPSTIPDTKAKAAPTVPVTTTSQPVSNVKLPTTQSAAKSTVTKPAPQTAVSKSTDIITKSAPISTSIAKTTAVSTSAVKGASTPTATAKSPPTSSGTIKTTPATSNAAKGAADSAATTGSSTKPSSVSASAGKVTSVPTSATKVSSASASAAKVTPVPTSAAKVSSVSTSAAKVIPSAPISTAKSAKTNTPAGSKATTTSVTATTTVSTAPVVSTSISTLSNKKGETKPTELSNGNKNFKA